MNVAALGPTAKEATLHTAAIDVAGERIGPRDKAIFWMARLCARDYSVAQPAWSAIDPRSAR